MQFGDLRGWIAHLEKEGELHQIDTEVDWDCELGTVTRRAFGNGDGPALLFNRIKDYTGGCTRLFTGGLSNYSRVALMFGLPKKAPITELVKAARKAYAGRLPPVTVATGPVKQNILTGDDINLFDFPVPRWHRRDGGRYINTMQGTVTRDPSSGRVNVGVYRGMIGHKDTIPVLLWRPQNWGQDFAKYSGKGEEMPMAFIYGWEPCLPFCAASPVPPDVSEYDVMGALRGAPVELVNCETVPLQVPASAEIVIEGWISPDPATFEMEGPFGEYFRRRPVPQAPGAGDLHLPPRQPDLPRHAGRHLAEDAQRKLHHELGAARRLGLEHSGALRRPGGHRRALPARQQRHHADDPAQADLSRLGQAGRRGDLGLERRASALQEHLGGRRRHRHPRLRCRRLGLRLPRQRGRGRHRVLPRHLRLRSGPQHPAQVPRKWCRVLIDATVNLDFEPEANYGGERYPPMVRPDQDDWALVERRWDEYGFKRE